ncbi:hypothetical protein ACEWPL_017985 [Roseovarius sp. S1116L3]|uniref:hypothetical protein n=1 Tax=Roseovarius roseus TaxID=3342636 RepID=UPI00372BF44F
MPNPFRLSFLYGLLLAPCASAQQPDDAIFVNQASNFNVTVRQTAEISGARVLGVVHSGDPDGQLPELYAHVPYGWTGAFCARLVTADGFLEATGTYDTKGRTGRFHRLELGSGELSSQAWMDRLRDLPMDSVAVRVRAGACGQPAGPDTVAFWNIPPISGGEEPARLYFNSLRASDVILYQGDDAKPVKCSMIRTGLRKAYDTVCPIQGSSWTSDGPLEIKLFALRNGDADPPVIFSLHGLPRQ